MAKRNEPYRSCIVESYYPLSTAGLHGPVHIRPIAGQPFPTHLHVWCNKDLTNPSLYKVGTRFRLRAKLTDRHADAFRARVRSDADRDALVTAGKEVLQHLPVVAGGCMMMSAVMACRLEKLTQTKPYVVAGSLHIGSVRIFGEDVDIDGVNRFSKSDASWDGHGWVVLGDYLVDVSLFGTSRSPKSSPILARHVLEEFGEKAGLFVCRLCDVEKSGLIYTPQYVLKQDQVDALARGAMAIWAGSR